MIARWIAPGAALIAVAACSALASNRDTATSASAASARTVYRVPTLGGTVWWMDVWSQDGYRVQTHKIAGTHRLLDPANVLVTSGSFERCQKALAEELATPAEAQPANWNPPMPTMGAKQFWGDEFYDRGWQIQRNILTLHYRLIDPDGKRQAWGTYAQCRNEHQRLTARQKPRDPTVPLVIMLHGILRSPDCFDKLRGRLKKEEYESCAFAYPSSQASIADHGAELNRLLERLAGVEEIYFVCHSLGGLVARSALQQRPEPRLQSMVTMGTPHNGAIEANILKDWYPYKIIFGKSGQQLIAGSESFAASLGPVPCAIGCIAGGKSDDNGFSPIIPGDDDGTVGMSSALYEHADDTIVFDGLHSFLMYRDDVVEVTTRFIKTGRFRESGAVPASTTQAGDGAQ